MKKALLYGALASCFFSFTFVLNRSMSLSGGYWMWSACLRFIFMLPLLALPVLKSGKMGATLRAIRQSPGPWLLWSTAGFGVAFWALTMASQYETSWFISAAWQVTIVAGVLLTPLLGQRLPVKNLLMSGVILAGVFILQFSVLNGRAGQFSLAALGLILVAAFAYPLGNRKMMAVCPPGLSTVQRVFGMALCSMPFWLVFSGFALFKKGLPAGGQVLQAFLVALFSGVVATTLLFKATEMVKQNPKQLAVVEATQAGEVIFTLLGGVLLLGDAPPSPVGFVGMGVIVLGMVASSLLSAH
ncbi:MAG: multidrug resistance efflux transporter family protein [Oscillospiraceae bacterium]